MGLTLEVVDHASGMQSGYSGKLLSNNSGRQASMRCLGRLSFDLLAATSGVAFVMVEDPDALERVRPLLQKRRRPVQKQMA